MPSGEMIMLKAIVAMGYAIFAMLALAFLFNPAYACDDDRALSEMKRHNNKVEQYMKNEERRNRDRNN